MSQPAIGKRVRLLSPMVNPDSKWMPVENDIPAGLEGTIVYLSLEGPPEWQQIGVNWDNGRTLNLIPRADKFEVVEPKTEGAEV